VSTITEARAVTTSVVSHVPWWRGKIVQVAAIVGVMWLAYRGWKTEYPWPDDLVWNGFLGQPWIFDTLDADGDGLLDPQEAARWRPEMAG